MSLRQRMFGASQKLVTPVAIVATGVLVWQGSTAAFSVTTNNATNHWESGSLTLTNDAETAMFTATGLAPGATGEKCIVVTYNSDLWNSEIRMYGTGTGTIGPHLNLLIEKGTGGSNDDCTGFGADATVFNNTLDLWNAVDDYDSGTAGAHPVLLGADRNVTYKITYTLANTDAALGKEGDATFTWEARSA